MKIFISHAVVDKELVGYLADLLQLGAGVSRSDIFFSSRKGAIPNGAFFVKEILVHLDSANVVVAVISKTYFKRRFCLQELGAAQARSYVCQNQLFSMVVPPVVFGDLDAMMLGVQSGEILAEHDLDELQEVVTKGVPGRPPISEWNKRRGEFLAKARPLIELGEARELMDQVIMVDLNYDRDSSPGIKYQLKMNVTFANHTRRTIVVNEPAWTYEAGQLPQKDKWSGIQTRNTSGGWQDHTNTATISNGADFRACVAFEPKVSDEELRQRHEILKIGTMVLPLKINGYDVKLEKKL